MKNPQATPADMWRTGLQLQQLVLETQFVMVWRLMGMAGVVPAAAGENKRMIAEKPAAFAEAAMAAGTAALKGRRADQILSQWMRPLRQRTGANAKRLAGGTAR